MKTKKQYIAPEMTVVTFRAERGYAQSGGLQSNATSVFSVMVGSNNFIENISTGEAWTSDNETFGDSW